MPTNVVHRFAKLDNMINHSSQNLSVVIFTYMYLVGLYVVRFGFGHRCASAGDDCLAIVWDIQVGLYTFISRLIQMKIPCTFEGMNLRPKTISYYK